MKWAIVRLKTIVSLVRGGVLMAPLLAATLGISTPHRLMASSDPIEIAATLRHAVGALELNWLLANRGAEALRVFTQPLQHKGEASAHQVYVRLADETTVEFSLQAFAVPAGLGVMALDRIGATVLPPDGRLDGTALLQLPLRTQVP